MNIYLTLFLIKYHNKNNRMKINRIMFMDQTSDDAEDLAIKNNTTKSICGYIVCGLC